MLARMLGDVGARGQRHPFNLISLEVHLLLAATQCGWTAAQWERWTTATVIDSVLR